MSNAPTQFSFVVACSTSYSFLMNFKVPSISNGVPLSYIATNADGSVIDFNKHHSINHGYIRQTTNEVRLQGIAGSIPDSFTIYGIVIYK